jgi:3-hydroxyisobutyrate dehydrogenase-like beta-hydroxyacid dehydrogenase
MGSAFATLLLRSGVSVVGFDIDERRSRQLQATGGRVARSAADVAGRCPVVLTSLPTAAAFHDALAGPRGLVTAAGCAGLLVVDLSTLALQDKDRGRRALEDAGARLVDAPVSGTGSQARDGDIVAFVSANDPADRREAIGWLSRFTRAQYDVGVFGNGSRFKFVANLLVAIHNVAAAEALVLAEQASLDLDLVLQAVGSGAGGSRMLDIRGPMMTSRNYDPAVRLEVFLKDIALITDFAEAAGAPTPLLAACREIYDAARADGRLDQDSACVAEVLRGRAARDEPR